MNGKHTILIKLINQVERMVLERKGDFGTINALSECDPTLNYCNLQVLESFANEVPRVLLLQRY